MIDASWDPTFVLRHDLFETVADAARPFSKMSAFPTPEQIDEALASRAGVRFVRQAPRSRRSREPVEPDSMYDARIVKEGAVPTRPGSWHDFLNALVWATFPIAKRALHERQHRLVVRAGPAAPKRTTELDALALVDEGGIAIVQRKKLVFGHAVYESLVRGWRPPVAAAIQLACTADEVDSALAAFVEKVATPRDMHRVSLGD
jgi:hypothetical protein